MKEERKAENTEQEEQKPEEGTSVEKSTLSEEEIIIKPPSEEEEETEEGTEESQEEEEEKEEDSFKKRYKDLQSHTDKREARYKKLLDPFKKNIVEDEKTGDLSFKFDDTPQKEEDIPEAATQEDWDLNSKTAEEKQFQYREYNRKKEQSTTDKLAKESRDADDANKEYKKVRIEGWSKAQELYPDVKDKEGDLFKKSQEIFDADPRMIDSPFCDLTAVKLAAMELGITPQTKKSTSSKGKSTYIIGGSSGSGGKGEKELSDDEFGKLSSDKQREYMEKQFLKEE